MQNNEKKTEDKIAKTTALIGLVNLILSPLYLLDAKIGLTASLAANALLLQQFYELGKRRRPGSNMLNSLNTFFSSKVNSDTQEVDNALRNIANGGDAVFDELSTFTHEVVNKLGH